MASWWCHAEDAGRNDLQLRHSTIKSCRVGTSADIALSDGQDSSKDELWFSLIHDVAKGMATRRIPAIIVDEEGSSACVRERMFRRVADAVSD